MREGWRRCGRGGALSCSGDESAGRRGKCAEVVGEEDGWDDEWDDDGVVVEDEPDSEDLGVR